MARNPRYNGWMPDKLDKRDRGYSDIRPKLKMLAGRIVRPKAVDLRTTGFLPAVFDQGQVGSCVANATAGAIAFAEAKEGNGCEVMSRLFIYYNARDDKNVDSGTYIREAVKTIPTYGVCLETLWPYIESKWPEKPSQPAYDEAYHREIGVEYYRVDTHNARLDCLAQGYPIIFGATVYEGLEHVDAKHPVVPMPGRDESPLGGHAMLIVGYDDKKKCYLVRNSWGAAWGMAGYCWFPYKYLDNPNLADDFWTIRAIAK